MFVDELLKKGVPVSTNFPILLKVKDVAFVLRYSNQEKKFDEATEKFYAKMVEKFGPEFADMMGIRNHSRIEVITDQNTLERKLIISPFNVLSDLDELFNTSCFVTGRTDSIDSLLKILEICTEEEMAKNFPSLYSYYKNHTQVVASLHQVGLNQRKIPDVFKKQYAAKYANLYKVDTDTIQMWINDSMSKYSYKKFLEHFIKILNIVKDNFEYFYSSVIDISKSDVVSLDIDINEKDVDKFDMLLAYTYLDYIKGVEPEYQQNYLYYLSDFFTSRKDLVDNYKKLVLPNDFVKAKDMYEEYQQILVNNPSLKLVNFEYSDFNGMSVAEVDEFINEYLQSFKINWDVFDGKDIDNNIIEIIRQRYGEQNGKLTDAEIEQLISLFIEKKEFFDKTDPYYRIFGKNAFDGYVGYIYHNGLVVLEKFFENAETGKIATEQAIYTMDIKEFYQLTKLSKNQIIANNLCKRFIHKGDWQSRVSNYISMYKSDSDVVSEVAALKQGY